MGADHVAALDDLAELHPDRLYLFAAGPGEGEGLLLRIPGAGWIAFDGCRSGAPHRPAFGVLALLQRLEGQDELLGVVLTHPHQDHAHGIPELIERYPPRWAAVTGLDGKTNLVRQAKALAQLGEDRDRVVIQAAKAIQRFESTGGELLSWSAGDSRCFPGGVTLHVAAPDRAHLEAVWSVTEPDRISRRANEMSIVVEVVFGDTRVVLGGDLPHKLGASHFPAGWTAALANQPGMAEHHGLKIPHHGSREALCPRLLDGKSGTRAWLLTPFNSQSLPRTDDGDGLDQLLHYEPRLMLTAASASRKLQAAKVHHPITRQTLDEVTAAAKSNLPSFSNRDTTYRFGTATGPLDAVWGVEFDDAGRITGRWCGSAAWHVEAGNEGTG